MCGILGIAKAAGRDIALSDAEVARLCDRLAHRGPDGAGIWRGGNVVLGHRRLAVIDPSDAGAQPMTSAPEAGASEGRFVLVYNGELYNDAELRRDLSARGAHFKSNCDTETVLAAWATWGTAALERMRGMFAFAVYDRRLKTLTLVRDPLGIKPLYWWTDGSQLVFASEVRAILAHPDVTPAPNMRMVSAYLTTIRTVLGEHTLFEGVRSLCPGQMLQCDLGLGSGGRLSLRTVNWWRGQRVSESDLSGDEAALRVRSVIEDSVRRHLRSDVPMCTLLSGGIDSSIIASVACAHIDGLRSFCAGARSDGPDEERDDDLAHARHVAQILGTRHAEAPITRELFRDRWPWMVEQMGVPLSTPNEVAIHEVARTLRAEGCIVTLSGEGADELLAGYEMPMDSAAAYLREGGGVEAGGLFELGASAWVPLDFKQGLLSPGAWAAAQEDRWLQSWYTQEFHDAASDAGSDGLAAHLRFHRRVNLTGLLSRLDTATMLAGVEGRTPFADADVAGLLESLPMSLKYREPDGAGERPTTEGGVALATSARTQHRTKIVLRRAFAETVPRFVIDRPKASFPLPFQQWVSDQGEVLGTSTFARDIFSPAAIDAVCTTPGKLWHLAWPMINIALWGERWGW